MPGLVIGGTGHYVGEGWIGSGDAAGDAGISATLSVTDAGDTLAATAELEVRAAVNVVDAGDAIAATAALELRAVAALQDAGDAIAAAAALQISALGDDPLDLDPGDAGADLDDADDTLVATATLAIGGAAALVDAGDTLAATADLEGAEEEPAPAPATPVYLSGSPFTRARRTMRQRSATSSEDRQARRELVVQAPRLAHVMVRDADDELVVEATIRETTKSIGRRRALSFLLIT